MGKQSGDTEIKQAEDAISDFFLHNPRSPLLHNYCTHKNEATRLDNRKVRIIACFCSALVDAHLTLNPFGVASALNDTNDHSSLLEWRRVVAMLTCDGVLEVVEGESRDAYGILPDLRLSKPVVELFLGGKECMAFLSHETINEVRALANNITERARDRRNQNIMKQREITKAKTISVKRDSSLVEFVQSLPVLSPQQMFDALTAKGMVGQDISRRQLCLGVHRHISRLRKIHLEKMPAHLFSPTPRYLIRGDTGCGKSFCITTLAGLVGLPWTLVDITLYSETGFVGEDITQIPTRLLNASNGNIEIAQIGIIAIDEIDKVANSNSATHQLVSREGVQRSLLIMLGGNIMSIPTECGWKGNRCARVSFDTSNVMFYGLGAFSGWSVHNGKPVPPIGFNSDAPDKHTPAPPKADDYAKYGLMSELVGRFTGGVIQFDPLNKQDMMEILNRNTISKYADELAMDGIMLIVEPDVPDLIVTEAMARGTGARGLHPSLLGVIQEACFSVYSTPSEDKCIHLYVERGAVRWALDRTAKKPITGRTEKANLANEPDTMMESAG